MAVIQSSVFVQLLLALWAGLCAAAHSSAVCGFFCRVGRGLRGWAQGSTLCRFICREGVLVRFWPESLTYRALRVLANLPPILLRRLEGAAQGSVLCRWVRGSWMGNLLGRLCAAPAFGLGLAVMAFLVVPHQIWNNLYGLICAAAVLCLFYAGAVVRPRRLMEPERMGPYWTAYTCMICLGLILSRDIALSSRFFLFHVTALLLAVLTVSIVRRFEQVQLLAAMAMLGITVAALYGCWQIFAGTPATGSSNNLDLTLDDGAIQRIFSFFDNPNNFAELLVMLVPLDFALIRTARTKRGRFFAVFALIPCLVCLAFTYSRSGFIALFLAVLLFFAFQNWRVIPVFLLLTLAILPILPRSIYERVLSISDKEDTSISYRFLIYEKVWEFLKDHWVRGVGLGSDVVQKVMKAEYKPMGDGTYPVHAHDNYLQIWCETGILGLLSLLALLGGQIKDALRAFRRSTDPRVKVMLAAAVSSFCGILAIGVAEYTWFYPRNMFLYFFLFGLIGACIKLARNEARN